jgi:hypothetical protein
MEAKPRQRDGDINARSQDKIRSSIKAQEIVDCLNSHILGQLKMTNTQVRAAEILLRKIQPDLVATHLTTDDGQGLPLLKIVRAVQPQALEHEQTGGDSKQSGGDRQIEHVSVSSSEVEPD